MITVAGWKVIPAISCAMGFPGGYSGLVPSCQCKTHKRLGFDPWRREWLSTLVFLPGESHGQRSLASYSPQGCKELDTTEVDLACMHEFCYSDSRRYIQPAEQKVLSLPPFPFQLLKWGFPRGLAKNLHAIWEMQV